MAYFEILDVGTTFFTVKVSELQHDFTIDYYNNIKLNYDAGNNYWVTLSELSPINIDLAMEFKTVEFTYYYESGGLQNGETYRFLVSAETIDGNNYIIKAVDGEDYLEITIPSSEGGGEGGGEDEGTDVPCWSWTESNGSANAEATITAHNAITNRLATTGFPHKVWNDMVDKVIDLGNAIDGVYVYWDETYASYSGTKMRSGDRELTAERFNSLRRNIELYGGRLEIGTIPYSDIPYPVYSGDRVLGEYFMVLTDYINACIQAYNEL